MDVGPSAAAGPEVGMAMSVVITAMIDRISTDAIAPREDAPIDCQDSEDGRYMDVSPDTFNSSQDREESVGPVAGRKVADADSLMSDGSDLTDIENDSSLLPPSCIKSSGSLHRRWPSVSVKPKDMLGKRDHVISHMSTRRGTKA